MQQQAVAAEAEAPLNKRNTRLSHVPRLTLPSFNLTYAFFFGPQRRAMLESHFLLWPLHNLTKRSHMNRRRRQVGEKALSN